MSMTIDYAAVIRSAEAAKIARRLPAARRRAATARAQADRNPSPDNLNRAAELEAGLARMEAGVR
jgi:hypothetical protein